MAKSEQKILDHFSEVDIQKPSDIIIKQIRGLISSGILKPGDRLPSERVLVNKFGVGRGYVREAIKKLEFYGILKTVPQSGTIVASLGVKALDGLITNILDLEKDDFKALLETRALLEIEATRLAAIRATEEEIMNLKSAHLEFSAQVEADQPGLEEDLMFHLKIAEYCKNSVLRSLITLITPDIITSSKNLNICRDGRSQIALREHQAILDNICSRNPEEAAKGMRVHLSQTIALIGQGENGNHLDQEIFIE